MEYRGRTQALQGEREKKGGNRKTCFLGVDYIFFDIILCHLFLEDRMLDGKTLAKFLRKRGVSTLYHVNTTATALTFLRNGGLLSRHYVEEHPETCFQTIQKSDATDKKFGIFNDIFFDVMNIWENSEVCFYGPVLFEYSVDVLMGMDNICVTRTNPQNWNSDDFYSTIDEIADEITDTWPSSKHIVLRNQQKVDFSKISCVKFYHPSHDKDLSSIVEYNRPDMALKDIEKECEEKDIPCSISYLRDESWESILGHANTVGRFYGFRMKVPNKK